MSTYLSFVSVLNDGHQDTVKPHFMSTLYFNSIMGLPTVKTNNFSNTLVVLLSKLYCSYLQYSYIFKTLFIIIYLLSKVNNVLDFILFILNTSIIPMVHRYERSASFYSLLVVWYPFYHRHDMAKLEANLSCNSM